MSRLTFLKHLLIIPFIWLAIEITIQKSWWGVQLSVLAKSSPCNIYIVFLAFAYLNYISLLLNLLHFLPESISKLKQKGDKRFQGFGCLILRTCYYSELFKYLQSEARKPGVKYVALDVVDIVGQNFTFLVNHIINGILESSFKEENPSIK